MENEEKKQLIKFHKKEIFTIIEDNTNEVPVYILTIANYKLKEFNTLPDCELYIMERPWELMVQVITIINDLTQKKENES